jgi:hypothetical protein
VQTIQFISVLHYLCAESTATKRQNKKNKYNNTGSGNIAVEKLTFLAEQRRALGQ